MSREKVNVMNDSVIDRGLGGENAMKVMTEAKTEIREYYKQLSILKKSKYVNSYKSIKCRS